MNRYMDWLRAARDDYDWGVDSLEREHFPQACFIAQQVAEKCMKALAYYRGYDLVKTHSVRRLAQELQINGEILDAAKELDQFYITARYPDAIYEGIPADTFTQRQAKEALEKAAMVLEKVELLIDEKSSSH